MITQEQVKKLFNYDSKTGILSRNFKSYSQLNIGTLSEKGYLLVGIGQSKFRVHRIAFLYQHGYLPKYIDHINGIRDDNRIENLRECTNSENLWNAKKRSNCSSDIKGVCWSTERKLWEAYINVNNKRIRLGRFWDEETAGQIVNIERLKLHGEFANYGGAV